MGKANRSFVQPIKATKEKFSSGDDELDRAREDQDQHSEIGITSTKSVLIAGDNLAEIKSKVNLEFGSIADPELGFRERDQDCNPEQTGIGNKGHQNQKRAKSIDIKDEEIYTVSTSVKLDEFKSQKKMTIIKFKFRPGEGGVQPATSIVPNKCRRSTSPQLPEWLLRPPSLRTEANFETAPRPESRRDRGAPRPTREFHDFSAVGLFKVLTERALLLKLFAAHERCTPSSAVYSAPPTTTWLTEDVRSRIIKFTKFRSDPVIKETQHQKVVAFLTQRAPVVVPLSLLYASFARRDNAGPAAASLTQSLHAAVAKPAFYIDAIRRRYEIYESNGVGRRETCTEASAETRQLNQLKCIDVGRRA
ncbi:hypothetical protein EVAR_50567_1 [Eumeta japonica]|uniref:Uncharacterized protein n=1 Tax=Eumeta variegata TaxID=151549 RepID=A0A4C1ZEM0_EUMVA|nr:hypothetical protein EVAR_50567_1 [Eumeta japonica]